MNCMDYLALLFGFLLGVALCVFAFRQTSQTKKGGSLSAKWLCIYSFFGLLFAINFLFVYRSITQLPQGIDYVWAILYLLVGAVLIHSAVVDIISFEIYAKPIYLMLICAFLLNIFLYLAGQPNNIIAGAIASIIFFLIIQITKKKGMGEGDLLIFTLMGLSLGLGRLIVSFYIMVLTGSLVGLILGVKYGKIKGIKIPFVPFMVLGYFVSLVWGNEIIAWYMNQFHS